MKDFFEPPVILDVEASGFGAQSYPVELGVVLSTGKRLSMLIKPEPTWTHWDKQAESVHGISRELLLNAGHSVAEVADAFNALLKGLTAYTDAWVVDKPWINTLFQHARRPMEFQVCAIEQIMNEAQFTCWDDTKQSVAGEFSEARHRASIDALIIQQTFLRTLEMGRPGSVDSRDSAPCESSAALSASGADSSLERNSALLDEIQVRYTSR